MEINIEKVKKDYYRADLVDLPGIPPIGEGKTETEAVIVLFFRLTHPNAKNWIKYIDYSELTINRGI